MNARAQLPAASEVFVDFVPAAPTVEDPLAGMLQQPATTSNALALPAAVIAILHGFDLQDRPLVRGIPALPGEIVVARSTVALRTEMLSASVVLVFEGGDPYFPIILGVVAASPVVANAPHAVEPAHVRIDDVHERLVLSAEREVVLLCGESSITLTRAGKVMIRGRHILSQASGYNRIKGAAIDIN